MVDVHGRRSNPYCALSILCLSFVGCDDPMPVVVDDEPDECACPFDTEYRGSTKFTGREDHPLEGLSITTELIASDVVLTPDSGALVPMSGNVMLREVMVKALPNQGSCTYTTTGSAVIQRPPESDVFPHTMYCGPPLESGDVPSYAAIIGGAGQLTTTSTCDETRSVDDDHINWLVIPDSTYAIDDIQNLSGKWDVPNTSDHETIATWEWNFNRASSTTDDRYCEAPTAQDLSTCLAACAAGGETLRKYCSRLRTPRSKALCFAALLGSVTACTGMCYAIHKRR